MRLVACLVVMAIAGACALPDREEFARGTPDAGGGGLDGSTTEAGTTFDGSTPIDAGPDAPAGFCPRTAIYCNDFSTGSASDIGSAGVSNGASLVVVNGTLESKLPLLPGKGFFAAAVDYVLPLGHSKVTIEVDVNVSSAAWNGGNLVILSVYYSGSPQDHAEELYIDGSISSVTTGENGQLLFDYTKVELKRDTWVHVKMETDFTAHNGSFRVFYDGVLAITHDGPIDFSPSTNTGFNIDIGMQRSNAPTPAITTTYDNFVISLP